MAIISTTRLRVRHWRFLPWFFVEAYRAAMQAKAAPGNLAVSIVNEARNTFWTGSAWASEEALAAFLRASPHRQVMPKLAKWCDEASVARWRQDAVQLPEWSEVHRRMQTEGRPSKVARPSPDHLAYKIAAPVVRPGQALVFK
jgi:hypothetical protein